MEILDLKTMAKTEIKENTIVALGNFDGCHIGHASVFQNAFYEAKKKGVKSVAYTFDTLNKGEQKSLFTLDEKISHIRKYGIDYIAIESFENVKNLSCDEFYSRVLLGELRCIGASCGFNYRFGKGAQGDCEKLRSLFEKNGGSVAISPKITADDVVISSTYLRSLIENGEVESACRFMPPYGVYAEVIQGKKLGRTLGFPTINQQIPMEKVVPKRGVYITEAYIGENSIPAITNVGVRPTVDGQDAQVNMETYVIGYNGDLYGSYIKVVFRKFIRNEKRFESINELKEQIDKDLEKAKEFFR